MATGAKEKLSGRIYAPQSLEKLNEPNLELVDTPWMKGLALLPLFGESFYEYGVKPEIDLDRERFHKDVQSLKGFQEVIQDSLDITNPLGLFIVTPVNKCYFDGAIKGDLDKARVTYHYAVIGVVRSVITAVAFAAIAFFGVTQFPLVYVVFAGLFALLAIKRAAVAYSMKQDLTFIQKSDLENGIKSITLRMLRENLVDPSSWQIWKTPSRSDPFQRLHSLDSYTTKGLFALPIIGELIFPLLTKQFDQCGIDSSSFMRKVNHFKTLSDKYADLSKEGTVSSGQRLKDGESVEGTKKTLDRSRQELAIALPQARLLRQYTILATVRSVIEVAGIITLIAVGVFTSTPLALLTGSALVLGITVRLLLWLGIAQGLYFGWETYELSKAIGRADQFKGIR